MKRLHWSLILLVFTTQVTSYEVITSKTHKEYDLKKNLQNKIYDIVAVTDDLSFRPAMQEDQILLDSLQKLGLEVTRISIQDPYFLWNCTKVVLLRSAWGKYSYYDEYVQFLEDVTQHSFLWNPLELIRWQSDRTSYMKTLANYVNVPETVVLRPGQTVDLEEVMEDLDCDRLVMKPAHGNGAHGVKEINEDNMDDMYRYLEDYLENDDEMLIQCYQNDIAGGRGEISTYFIAGNVTHGTASFPAEGDFRIHESYGGHAYAYLPAPEEVEFTMEVARAVEHIVGVTPLYMRVDMIYDNNEKLALTEIASGTTDLNLKYYPPAADVLAKGLYDFLVEKNTQYETLYGVKSVLIDEATFETLSGITQPYMDPNDVSSTNTGTERSNDEL